MTLKKYNVLQIEVCQKFGITLVDWASSERARTFSRRFRKYVIVV